jgi:hypothetical protein
VLVPSVVLSVVLSVVPSVVVAETPEVEVASVVDVAVPSVVVSVVVVVGERVHHETRVVFLGGANGRSRAALAAAHILLTTLRRGATD